jgi:hypothetical protein
MRFNIALKTSSGELAFMTSSHNITKDKIQRGNYELTAIIPKHLLNTNRYIIAINAGIPGYKYIFKQ